MASTFTYNLSCCGKCVRLPIAGDDTKRYCGSCGCDWFIKTEYGKVVEERRVWMRQRETQQFEVYGFEARAFQNNVKAKKSITLQEAQSVIRLAWDWYVSPSENPPVVVFTKATRWSWGSRREIKLAVNGQMMDVLLHEIAHAVLNYWAGIQGDRHEKHGGRFVRMEAVLFEAFGICTEQEFIQFAMFANLAVATRQVLHVPTVPQRDPILTT